MWRGQSEMAQGSERDGVGIPRCQAGAGGCRTPGVVRTQTGLGGSQCMHAVTPNTRHLLDPSGESWPLGGHTTR